MATFSSIVMDGPERIRKPIGRVSKPIIKKSELARQFSRQIKSTRSYLSYNSKEEKRSGQSLRERKRRNTAKPFRLINHQNT